MLIQLIKSDNFLLLNLINLDLVGLISSGRVSTSIPKSKKLSVSTLFSLTISNVAVLNDSKLDPMETFVTVVIPVSEKFFNPVGWTKPFTVDDSFSYVWLLLIVYDRFW